MRTGADAAGESGVQLAQLSTLTIIIHLPPRKKSAPFWSLIVAVTVTSEPAAMNAGLAWKIEFAALG
jgi:hypothetical protein